MSTGEIVGEYAVRFTRELDAAPQKIWTMLTDCRHLPEWYGEGVIEPREGGAVSLMGGHIRGVVTGWRPLQFLAYSWNLFQPEETISRWPISYLEFALERSKLVLIHRPIPERLQKQTMMGWHTMLDLLEASLKGQFPRRVDLMAKSAQCYGVEMRNVKW
jgi:uncharacterized protein YndB with AHSA1/START domain